MKQYRRTFILLLISIMLILCSCVKESQNSVEHNQTSIRIDESLLTNATPFTIVPGEVELAPVFDDYTYIYTDQRNLDWEMDVIYFAQLFLGEKAVKGHPYLVSEEVQVTNQHHQYSMRSFYNPEKRDIFIQEIRILLQRIPELTDTQIIYELQRIVALLGDAHSRVYLNSDEYFPFVLEPLSSGGELGLYVSRLPKEYDSLLFAKLIAINDVPIADIFELLIPYISRENDYRALAGIVGVLNDGIIMKKSALQVIGVVGLDDDVAQFRFLLENGETVEIQLEALSWPEEYLSIELANYDRTKMGTLCYSQYNEVPYFFEYLPETDTLYIRIYSTSSIQTSQFNSFVEQIQQRVQIEDGVTKTILDFRDNAGGNFEVFGKLINYLNAPELGEIYLLINEGSFSAAALVPYWIKSEIPNAILVGTPAGQAPNTFGMSNTFSLRKHDVTFTISYGYCEFDADYEYCTLIPDWLVYPTLADYRLGIDTILEAVLNFKE